MGDLDKLLQAFTKEWRYKATRNLLLPEGFSYLQKRAYRHKAWINALRDEASRCEFTLVATEDDLRRNGESIPEYPRGEFLDAPPF